MRLSAQLGRTQPRPEPRASLGILELGPLPNGLFQAARGTCVKLLVPSTSKLFLTVVKTRPMPKKWKRFVKRLNANWAKTRPRTIPNGIRAKKRPQLAVLINRPTIHEAFDFAAWQRLRELGLGEEGIAAKRIELYRKILTELVDKEAFLKKLVELGLVILKVKITNNKGYSLHQSVVLAGPPAAYTELDRWWKEQTGEACPLFQHLEWHHANSPLVLDRWEEGVAHGTPFVIGTFSERDSRL